MGWLDQQVFGQPHLVVQTKQIVLPPEEQKELHSSIRLDNLVE